MNPFKIETSNLSKEMNEISNQRFDYISSDDAKNFHSAEPWHSNFEFGDTSCNDQNMEYLPEILKNQTFIHESLIGHCQSLENILTKHPFMQPFNAIACELIEQGVIACDVLFFCFAFFFVELRYQKKKNTNIDTEQYE